MGEMLVALMKKNNSTIIKTDHLIMYIIPVYKFNLKTLLYNTHIIFKIVLYLLYKIQNIVRIFKIYEITKI